ncbi:MAG: DUF2961 domain-containing protein [Bacteroidetes bacterium]|nr:DUF2961 domain-containing protein [Bacteroidota bacterium]
MYKGFLAFIIFFIWGKAVHAQQRKTIGLKDFLQEYVDVSSLPSYQTGAYSAETSTYDRTGLNNDGFEGTYSYIRKNPDSSLVIFDVKGTGVINRIWTPTPSDDSLEFYIDDQSKPAFTICYMDLFSGKVYPFVAPLCANQLGGYYCYLPIPFNESCKIVFKGKLTRFHQIGYRLYPKGTTINKFNLSLNKEESDALTKIKSIWEQSSLSASVINKDPQFFTVLNKDFELQPGTNKIIFETNRPGRIAGFELSSSESLENIAKNIDLKITWDDEKSPAVFCPLADYFGYAFGKPSMKSLLIGSDAGKNYSYFPMPFDKSATIELLYRKPANITDEKKITFHTAVVFNEHARDINNEGKFYAYWRRENPVPMQQPFTMLNVKGRGHFVGTVLQAQGLNSGMTSFFEGDDSTVVDGELRMHGTGSEDFFNGGWYALLDCWDAAMSLPLSGALVYSIPFCRTGGYRLFLGDKIPFEKTFFHSIEHGPEHNLVPADYTSVSYYYCDQNNFQKAIPSNENTRVYVPDTLILYPQLLNVGIEGRMETETRWGFPTGGLTYYYSVDKDTKLRISLTDIPAGKYRVFVDYVKNPEGAMFSIWQRQTALTDWIDSHNDAIARVPLQDMADVVITPLNNTISFRFKSNQKQGKFILNRIVLIKNKSQ